MAKPELGTKRTCPETGRKFYDLNRDPVISPYTGNSYPVTAFEVVVKGRGIPAAVVKKAEVEEEAEVEVDTADVELVSLEEADSDTPPKKKAAASDDDIEIEDDDDSDDTFLPDDEESDDDVSDLIDGDIEDDEET